MSNLPEDIETELKKDFARGIESFRQGGSMRIGGLVLLKDVTTRKFTVNCYSSKYFLENTTQAEAKERITTAKEEIAGLLTLFPELHSEIRGYSSAYYFCYDTGKAGVVMATEEDGQFEYLS